MLTRQERKERRRALMPKRIEHTRWLALPLCKRMDILLWQIKQAPKALQALADAMETYRKVWAGEIEPLPSQPLHIFRELKR